jgi:alkylation response protein AidB-like acyl-CoA dehydrogenase
MNLSLDANQQQIREAIQGFVRSEVTPNSQAWDGAESLPRDRVGALADLGMLGVMVGEAHDGVGLGLLEATLVLEEIARGDGGLAVAMAGHAVMAAPHIQRTGSEAQRSEWLPRLAVGERLAAWAHGESGGVTLDALETTATATAGGWTLTGHKRLVPGGAVADVFVVVARVGEGASAFLVPADTDGLTVSTPGVLGLRAGGLVDLALVDVTVPSEAELGGGWEAVTRTLAAGRVALAAIAAGLGSRAIDDAARYALQRKQFGKAIAEFQAIQNRLADADVGIQGGRLLVHRAAATHDADRPVARDAAMAYVHTATAAFEAADNAIQIHGGNGYVREYHVERLWRDARTLAALAGTPSVARDAIAAGVYA